VFLQDSDLTRVEAVEPTHSLDGIACNGKGSSGWSRHEGSLNEIVD